MNAFDGTTAQESWAKEGLSRVRSDVASERSTEMARRWGGRRVLQDE